MAKKQHTVNEHDDFILKPDLSIRYEGKASLKRSEETGIPLEDEAVIASMEGDAAIETGNGGLAALYARTRLHPDKNITFPRPAALKKRPATIPLYARYAAAAVILLLFGVGGWYLRGPEKSVDHNKYELAKLDMIKLELHTGRTMHKELSNRISEEMRVSTPVRESIEIHALSSLAHTPIDHTARTSSPDIAFQYRPSNIQFPTSDIAYAGNQEPPKKGLIGRIFSGFFNKVSAPFESKEKGEKDSRDDGFLWNVAQLGVKSINVLGDHDYTLVRDYNEKGNVKGVIVLEE